MYTYKNKVTGVVVTTYNKVSGDNWVRVKPGKAKSDKVADDNKENDGE